MPALNTQNLSSCFKTLKLSYTVLLQTSMEDELFEVYRLAVIKGFELTLEVTAKLLRKALKQYGASVKQVDTLTYKQVFRESAKHNIIDVNLAERWFAYRDNRNDTAHDYGLSFTHETLTLLPNFLEDLQTIIASLNNCFTEN